MYSLPIEDDVGGLDHGVGGLDRADETFRFDESERFLTHEFRFGSVPAEAADTDAREARSGEGGNSNRLRGMRQLRYNPRSPSFTIVSTSSATRSSHDSYASTRPRCRARPRAALVHCAIAAACRRKEAPAPPVATPSRHAEPRPGAARQPDRHHLQVRRRERRAVHRGLPRHGRTSSTPTSELILDVRSQPAGADDAVEARADDRVHANGVRPDLPVRRRGGDSGRAVLDGQPEAAAARGRGRRPARLQGREAAAAAADRERVHGVQGRLAPGGSRRAQRARVEWQWTKKDATLSFKNPKKDCRLLSRRRQPRQRVHTSRSRSRSALGDQAG